MKDVPLVLIHGYPFDRTMWLSTIASLGSGVKVIALDLPGFGKNPPSERHPSLDVYAEFIAQTLDEQQQKEAVVVGMSMGGYVALAFAEHYPERLLGLGLVSSQAAADAEETRKGRYESIRKIRAQGPSVVLDSLVPKMFSGEKGKQPGLAQYPIRGAQSAGIEGLCWALEAMAKRPDRTILLKNLNLPVLVVHGSDDQIVPCSKARDLAESCQKPILVEVRGVGHASPLEAPDQVAMGLARLMNKCREETTVLPKAETTITEKMK